MSNAGPWLQRYYLHELSQLINIPKGEQNQGRAT
jgi:hypothetical protein